MEGKIQPFKGSKEILIQVKWDARLRLRIFREKGRGITGFVSQLELFFKNKWTPVIRYDTAHGFVHKDVYSLLGKQKRKERISIKNLKEAVKYADRDLRKNYEEYIEKFKRDEL